MTRSIFMGSVTIRVWLVFCLTQAGNACSAPQKLTPSAPDDTTFKNPRRVALGGYDDHAMEPFLSRDGQWLFFNNRNDPPDQTDLHIARAVTPDSFHYAGRLAGANVTGSLDGVASMDAAGRFYWVSVRSYDQSLATLYRGAFSGGTVTGAALVAGSVVRGQPGWLIMDAEVASDGLSIVYADSRFAGGPVPAESRLASGVLTGNRIDRDPRSEELFREVNASAPLVYAPAMTANSLELFFTGLTLPFTAELFHATRATPSSAWGNVRRIVAATGFVEGATITPDGRSLYYHKLDGARYRLYRLTR